MRKLVALAILLVGCRPSSSVSVHPTVASNPPAVTASAPYGMTIAEEGRILALEDRREWDSAMAAAWIAHPNPIHRARMALALGRIGPATFIDANGNGERDPGEHQAGVALLATLNNDPERQVRETAAFALGAIGDSAGIDALIRFAHDADASVAGEAVEGLSKMAAAVTLARYREFTAAGVPTGVRIRAVRYLFRFDSDDASSIAASLLDSPDVGLRSAAAYALARRAYAPARSVLELLLTDPDADVRTHAAGALGRIGSKESVAPLLGCLRDPQPWVRTNALVALARVVAKDDHAIDRPGLPQDAQRIIDMTDDPDPGTRASSIPILGAYAARNDLARQRLRDLLTSGSKVEREIAFGAWAKDFYGAANANEPMPRESWEKVRVLEATTALPVGATLRARFYEDGDLMVRANVIANIPDGNVDAEIGLIRRGLDEPDVIVRANAIDRYSKSKAIDATVLLAAERRGQSDKMDDARLAAITAIASVDRPEREPFLRALLTDADPVVRRIAADQIEQVLKKPRPQYTPLPVAKPASEYEQIAQWSHTPHRATIRTARGPIEIALLTQDAPMTTWNFAALAGRHYFDGTTFMRVVPNFVIQGGDPRNDMSGGPGYAIRDEINMEKYTRGAVGMALSGPDTGGSQFFITHSAQPHLDGGYTVFGRVTGGLAAIVDQTERGDRVDSIVIDGGGGS